MKLFIGLSLLAVNLVLDFGNTLTKAAVFDTQKSLVEKRIFISTDDLMAYVNSLQSIQQCLIGSVTNAHIQASEFISQKFKTILFTSQTSIPIQNAYKSARTLGSDRLAVAIGAHSLYPNKNVLSIDAGTCIKYNFVNQQNQYLGGAISPGLSMRLKAMHHYTAALPIIETDLTFHKLIGETTNESMLSGALIGAVAEVEGMITRYEQQYEQLVVLITGGDGIYLCEQVKKRFFADPDLLIRGLNTILDFNSEI